MDIFDLIGPVMVGPSSSHTAGAVRIGYVARKLLGEEPKSARITLHGSFAATGRGHGTDKAIVAGLLGMHPDDERIPRSFELAWEQGLDFSFELRELRAAHPNTARLDLTGKSGRRLSMTGASVGGGRIEVRELDGIALSFSAEKPTLIIRNEDQPGSISIVSACWQPRDKHCDLPRKPQLTRRTGDNGHRVRLARIAGHGEYHRRDAGDHKRGGGRYGLRRFERWRYFYR